MRTNKKIMFSLIVAVLMFLSAGCLNTQQIVPLPGFTQAKAKDSVAKRFKESTQQGPTVVESAIELSEKYARVYEQMITLRQENHDLTTENRRLKDRLSLCENQLKQTQKELAEANDTLIEMRIELNNWRTDILGFRDEIRNADKAQLQTLLKIFEILGGKVKAESAQDKGSVAVPPNKPQLKETPTSGKSNE